jgi:hypothetical protein
VRKWPGQGLSPGDGENRFVGGVAHEPVGFVELRSQGVGGLGGGLVVGAGQHDDEPLGVLVALVAEALGRKDAGHRTGRPAPLPRLHTQPVLPVPGLPAAQPRLPRRVALLRS